MINRINLSIKKTALLVIALSVFSTAIASGSVMAASKYNTCLSAIKSQNKASNKTPNKNSQFKEGQTYTCPNANGASIVFSNKAKKQKYNEPSASNNQSSNTSGPNTQNTNVPTTTKVRTTAKCGGGSFFSFPTWYQYLNCDQDGGGVSQDQDGSLVALVILALINILLVVAGMAAIAYGIYGGFRLITSQGQPDGIAKGRTVLMNAVIGLIIAIISSSVVSFIANKIS